LESLMLVARLTEGLVIAGLLAYGMRRARRSP
jgi:hypothetical protein